MDAPRLVYALQFGNTLSGAHWSTRERAEVAAKELDADRIVTFVEVLHTEASV